MAGSLIAAPERVTASQSTAPRVRPSWRDAASRFWVRWAPVVFIVLGAEIRIRQWLGARSLWLDEARISYNILQRGYRSLLEPLWENQGAPVGWLWSERTVVNLAGESERALRFVSLLAGLATLVLVWLVARRLLRPHQVPVMVGIVALSPQLVRYSNEVKQYSTDVVVGLVVILAALAVTAEAPGSPPWRRRIWTFGGVGAVVVAFSHPAVLFLAGAAVAIAVPLLLRRHWHPLRLWCAANLLWVAAWGVLYLVSLKDLSSNEVLRLYWSDAYPPSDAGVAGFFDWLGSRSLDVVHDPIGFEFVWVAAFLIVAGVVVLAGTRPRQAAVLLAAVPLFYAASAFRRYPFMGRLALAVVPLAACAVAALWPVLGPRIRGWQLAIRVLVAGAIVAIFLAPAGDSLQLTVSRYEKQELASVLKDVEREFRPGDLIVMTDPTDAAYRYYRERFGLPPRGASIWPKPARPCHEAEVLTRLARSGRRVWLVFGHRRSWWPEDAHADLRARFGQAFGLVAQFDALGADAWLFDPRVSPATDSLTREPDPRWCLGMTPVLYVNRGQRMTS